MRRLFFACSLCLLAMFTGCKTDEEPDWDAAGRGDDAAEETAMLRLNEICGGESDSKDDWVEIVNPTSAAISLDGLRIVKTDEDGIDEVVYTFKTGETIGAGGFFVVDNTDLSAGISNSKDVTITLSTTAGTQIDKFDKSADIGSGGHEIGGSYVRIPDATGAWTVTATATRGSSNGSGSEAGGGDDTEVPDGDNGINAIRLNELNGNDPKYIELYNTSAESVDITGVQLRKDDETIVYVAPEGTSIAAHGFLTLLSDQPDYSTGFTSGLSAKKSVMIELLAPDGSLLDVFKNPSISQGDTWGEKDPEHNGETNGQAYGRYPDGTGTWYMQSPTMGISNTGAEIGESIVF